MSWEGSSLNGRYAWEDTLLFVSITLIRRYAWQADLCNCRIPLDFGSVLASERQPRSGTNMRCFYDESR
jgi:hypothetical protein